jgi:hypothetical protein
MLVGESNNTAYHSLIYIITVDAFGSFVSISMFSGPDELDAENSNSVNMFV